jgi:D-glycero-D-manno-heptose 1,7-bisphosphate phosphatase
VLLWQAEREQEFLPWQRIIPKPMIKIAGKPVLEHEIECLRNQGFTDIIITVSHLGQIIMDYFGDGSGISPVTVKPFGVHIQYYFEREPLGNAGALYEIKDRLDGDFLLLNADSLFNVDFNRMLEYHKNHGGLATIFTHPNNHPYDSGLIVADSEYRVLKWLTKEDERLVYYKNRVNAGIHILNVELLKERPETPKVDLDRQILKHLAGTGKLVVYDSPEYVKDMGAPERYDMVCSEWESGFITSRNLLNKQKGDFFRQGWNH